MRAAGESVRAPPEHVRAPRVAPGAPFLQRPPRADAAEPPAETVVVFLGVGSRRSVRDPGGDSEVPASSPATLRRRDALPDRHAILRRREIAVARVVGVHRRRRASPSRRRSSLAVLPALRGRRRRADRAVRFRDGTFRRGGGVPSFPLSRAHRAIDAGDGLFPRDARDCDVGGPPRVSLGTRRRFRRGRSKTHQPGVPADGIPHGGGRAALLSLRGVARARG